MLTRPPWLSAGDLDRIEDRDGIGCVECRRLGLDTPEMEPLEVDHKQPRADGGSNHWSNLQVLCRGHNRGRGRRPLRDSRLPKWKRDQDRHRC